MKKMTVNPIDETLLDLSLQKDNTGSLPLKDKGSLFNAPKDKANIPNRQYQSTFTHGDAGHAPSPTGMPYQDMIDIQVEEEGVRKLSQRTSPRKKTQFQMTGDMQTSWPYSKRVLAMMLRTTGQFHLHHNVVSC